MRPPDGRCRRLARLHAVRDGRLGRRRRDGGLAEGADDAAGPRLRRRRAARQRSAQEGRPASPPIGTGRSAMARRTTRNIPARRRSICCSALRAALDLIFAEGFETVFNRHRLLAEATRRAVGTWAEGQSIAFNISEPAERSDTVTTVITRNGESAQPLLDYCREKCGVVLGRALGQSPGKAFRIAHMGHVNAPMLFGTLSVVEMALGALGIRMARAARRRRWSFWRKPCRPERRAKCAPVLRESKITRHGLLRPAPSGVARTNSRQINRMCYASPCAMPFGVGFDHRYPRGFADRRAFQLETPSRGALDAARRCARRRPGSRPRSGHLPTAGRTPGRDSRRDQQKSRLHGASPCGTSPSNEMWVVAVPEIRREYRSSKRRQLTHDPGPGSCASAIRLRARGRRCARSARSCHRREA